MPSTSPRRRLNEACSIPGATRPSTSSAGSAAAAGRRFGNSSLTVRPTMSAISWSLLTGASGPAPTVRPSRSTVNAVGHLARLLEKMADVDDGDPRGRRAAG